jgi:putative transcriptional regulator
MRMRIKEYRAKHDMTQADLTLKVGVRRETIVFLERGKYNPFLKLAHDVAIALGVKIDELFLWGGGYGVAFHREIFFIILPLESMISTASGPSPGRLCVLQPKQGS